MSKVLEVKNLSQNFGGLRALSEVDLEIREGEIVALIGPNGAGKTTFFNCITGIYTPTEGDVYLHVPAAGSDEAQAAHDSESGCTCDSESRRTRDNESRRTRDSESRRTRLNGMKPNAITELGMARTFQNIRVFPDMTVLENVMVGRHCRTKAGILGALLRDPATRREEQDTVERCYELLRSVHLHTQYDEKARNLSYGAQRRLEIARAMATEPHLLLLDEPAAGMNPNETLELEALVRDIRQQYRLSILLIEHDMGMVMSMSDRIYVMEYGARIAAGTPQEVRVNPRVIKAYLGEEDHA